MRQQGKHLYIKGMNLDLGPMSIGQGMYREALNMINVSEMGDLYDMTNEKGFSEGPDRIESSTRPGDNYLVIGHCVLNKEKIIFSVDSTNTYSEVGIIDEEENYITIVNSDELGFHINYQIDAVARVIYNNERVVYWVDNNNPARILNLDNPPATNVGKNTELFVSQKLPVVTYKETLEEGNIEVGVVQFVCRYLNDNLDPVYFGLVSAPIPVVEDFRRDGRNEYDGSLKGRNASKSIVLNVSNVDTDFNYIELIAITYTGPSDQVTAKIVQRKDIVGETMTFTYSDKNSFIDDVTLEELVLQQPSYRSAKCIEQADSHLILSGLKASTLSKFQELANKITLKYYIKKIPYTDVVDAFALPSGTFALNRVYVNLIEENTGAIVGKNTLVFQFSQQVSASVVAGQFALIEADYTAGTPNTVTYTRITPDSILVEGTKVLCTFTGRDFTDSTIYNFGEFTEINTKSMYTYGYGSDLDTISGTGTANVSNLDSTSSITGTGKIHSGYRSASNIVDSAGVITVTFSTAANLAVGDQFAMYGDVHTSLANGLFTVNTVVSTTEYTVSAFATGNETDLPAPAILASTADITIVESVAVTDESARFVTNQSYFEDYINEETVFKYRTYKRDEVYSFAFRGLFANGAKSPGFHIPGFDRSTAYDSVNPDNNRLAADTVNKRLGTYISSELYPTVGGYPSSSGTGYNYSAGGNIRHHKMPSMQDVPIVTYESGQYYINVIGVIPVWIDGTVEKSIKDLIDSDPEVSAQLSGFEIMRERRDTSEKRSVIMQGIAQKLYYHEGGGDLSGDFDDAYISNSYLLGKTKIHCGTRVYPRHDKKTVSSSTKKDFGYRSHNDTDYVDPGSNLTYFGPASAFHPNKSFCSFYSPDTILLGRSIPSGAKLKPIAIISGPIIPTAEVKPYGTIDADRRSGGLHILCSYNDVNSDVSTVSPATVPAIENTFQASYADETFDWAMSPIPEHASMPKMCNYMNEGYLCLDLGANPLPDVPLTSPEVTWHMQMTRNSNTSFDEKVYVEFPNGGNSERCLYDIIVTNSRQYGSLDSVEYVPAITVANLDDINDIDDALGFGGDIFISKMSVKNSNNFRWNLDYSDSGGSLSKFVGMHNARTGLSSSEEGEELRAVAYFFVESEVNCNYRHRPVEVANDGTETFGVPYFPNEPVLTGGSPTTVHYPHTTSFVVTRLSATGAGVLDTHPSLKESNGYNSLYSKENEIGITVSLPFGYKEITEYPNRSIYSLKSFEGEQSDKYRFFLANNYHDIPKHAGPIWNTFTHNGCFWIHTTKSLWKAFVNERTALLDQDFEKVYTGNGGLFSMPSMEVFTVEGGEAGCQSQWGGVKTPFGYVWVDVDNGKLNILTTAVNELSLDGMMKWFSNNIKPSIKPTGDTNDNFYDNPSNPGANGIVLGYDKENKRVMITKRDIVTGMSYTISYSLLNKSFTSFHTYYPTRYISVGDSTFCLDNVHTDLLGLKVFKMNAGAYGVYFNSSPARSEIEFVVTSDMRKVFDNLYVTSECHNEANNDAMIGRTFDLIQVYTDRQNTGEIRLNPNLPPVAAPIDETKVKFLPDGEHRIVIPKDAVLNPNTDIFDSSNLILSLPTGDNRRRYRPRIKNKYAFVKLIYNNENNYRLTLRNVTSSFRENYL